MTQPSARSITQPKGFHAGSATAGIKPSGRPDMALILADRPCAAAAVFTRNRIPGAPVIVGKRHFRSGQAQAIVINAGIANDATGQQGIDNAIDTCRLLVHELAGKGIEVKPRDVIPSSTGLIGPQLPMDKVARGVTKLVKSLGRGPRADAGAARAIMTTDMVPKSGGISLKLGNKTVRLAGIAKGSGMIAPNLATMLVFLTTDVAISPVLLRQALKHATAVSFNRISVDQHTSPSDTVAVLASGLAGNRTITKPGKALNVFTESLTDLCNSLAYQIVKDGEGATKVFHVTVAGACSEREADRVGKAVVDSPLVKTAVHGADPNWGRIVTAAGYSGASIQPHKMSLSIGGQGRKGVCVYQNGVPQALTAAQTRRLEAAMGKKEVFFTLSLGRGKARADWLGCDLSREYIRINADYTT